MSTSQKLFRVQAWGQRSFRVGSLNLLVAGSLLSSVNWVFAAPIFTGLGFLPNSEGYSSAFGISNDGSTIVGVGQVRNIGGVAFRWTHALGFESLSSESRDSWAYAASADGSVIAGGFRNSLGTMEAFRWTSATGMQSLGRQFESDHSLAHAVSANGQVVVGVASGTSSSSRAFRWVQGQALGNVAESPTLSVGATSVSADGKTVVGYVTNSGFIWNEATGLRDLSTVVGTQVLGTVAISSNGHTVAGSMASPTPGNQSRVVPFRWSAETGLVSSGALVPSGLGLQASRQTTAISDDGKTVVGTDGAGADARGFVWSEAKGVRSVDTVLQQDYKIRPNGWTLHQVTGISGDGRIIVGSGFNPNGQIEAWTARLPAFTPIQQAPAPPSMGVITEKSLSLSPGQLEFYGTDGFARGGTVAGGQKTFMLVHGWNADFGTGRRELKDEHPWIVSMAEKLRASNPDANILAWNWTEFASSTRAVVVPTLQLANQSVSLSRALRSFEGLADLQIMGHSLGAGIAATTADVLRANPGPHDTFGALSRITLFDAPENEKARFIGGRVLIEDELRRVSDQRGGSIAIENYIALGQAGSGTTGYGIAYSAAANTALQGHIHFRAPVLPTPMDWYGETVGATSGYPVGVGINEGAGQLYGRINKVWGNRQFGDDHDLVLLAGDTQGLNDRFRPAVLVYYSLGAAIAHTVPLGLTFASQSIAWLAGEVLPPLPILWSAFNEAYFEDNVGLRNVSSSPSFAFTTITSPANADLFYLEFEPEVWGASDIYVVSFDDTPIYYVTGDMMVSDTMNTGLVDISAWSGKTFTLSIGLISDEPGHQVLTLGFGFIGSVAAVPEPGTLGLLIFGSLVLVFRVRASAARQLRPHFA